MHHVTKTLLAQLLAVKRKQDKESDNYIKALIHMLLAVSTHLAVAHDNIRSIGNEEAKQASEEALQKVEELLTLFFG